MPLKKSRSLYFSCCLSGQIHGIWLRSAGQGAEVRSYPLRGCRVSLLPFALPCFRVSARVTPLSLERVEDKSTTPFQGTAKVTPLSLRSCWGLGNELTGRTQTPPQAPQSHLAFPLVSFPKEQAERLRGQHGAFLGRVYARLDCGACLAVRPIAQK